VLVLFALARALGGRPPGELSPRAQRARAQQSQLDLARFTERDQMRQMGANYATQ
jgi:phosphate transport system permease protein